jgi:hypothetical protein
VLYGDLDIATLPPPLRRVTVVGMDAMVLSVDAGVELRRSGASSSALSQGLNPLLPNFVRTVLQGRVT